MSRFECPSCGKALSRRLLAHVSRKDRQVAFACTHCQTVLTYGEGHIPLAEPLFRSKGRAFFTLLLGSVLLTLLAEVAGRLVALATVGLVAVVVFGADRCPRNQHIEPLTTSAVALMWPDPSLHPTAYSGLRPLPSAGELKRWASQSIHQQPEGTA